MEVWYANTVMGVVQYGNWITTQIPRGATPRTSIAQKVIHKVTLDSHDNHLL